MIDTPTGQWLVGNTDSQDITADDLNNLDPVAFVALMKQIEIEQEKEEEDRSPGFENIPSYSMDELKVNLLGEHAESFSNFLVKAHKAQLSEEECELIAKCFEIEHSVSVMGGDSFSPRVTLSGGLLIRNLHRVLGLDECVGIIPSDKTDLLLSSIKSIFDRVSKEEEHEDDCHTLFTLSSEEDGVTYYPEAIPDVINQVGQSILSIPPCIHEELVKLDTAFSCFGQTGRSGNMYLRFFEQQVLIYNDARYSDDFDIISEEYSIGFFDHDRYTSDLPDTEEALKAEIASRMKEEAYNFEAVDELPNGPIKSVFNELMEDAVTSKYHSIAHSGLEPIFKSNYQAPPHFHYLDTLTSKAELSGEYVLFSMRPNGLEEAFLDGDFGATIKERFDTIVEAMDAEGMADQISSVKVYIPEEYDGMSPDNLLGDIDPETIDNRIKVLIDNIDKDEEPESRILRDDREESIDCLYDFFSETNIIFVVRGDETMSTKTAYDIAQYLSIDRASTAFFLSRLPVYHSFSDKEADSCSNLMPMLPPESDGQLYLIEEDDWDDEDDDDWDDE